MYIKMLAGALGVLAVSGCATLAAQFTVGNSVDILKKLINLTSTPSTETLLAQPDQREQLLTIKSEVDAVIRTVSEAEDMPPPSQQQMLVGALPQLNNSLEKSLNLAKSIAGELYSQSLVNSMLNNPALQKKREFGGNLLSMYRQLAILKKKIWLALEQPEKARKMAEEYAVNIRLMQELCSLQGNGNSANCLELPATELAEEKS